MAKGGKHNYIIVLPFNPFNSGNVRKINSFNQMNGAKGTIFVWDENFTFFSQNPQILMIHDFVEKKHLQILSEVTYHHLETIVKLSILVWKLWCVKNLGFGKKWDPSHPFWILSHSHPTRRCTAKLPRNVLSPFSLPGSRGWMGRSGAPLATNHQNHHITKFLAFLIAISTKPLPKDVSAKIDQICPILVPSSLVVFLGKCYKFNHG